MYKYLFAYNNKGKMSNTYLKGNEIILQPREGGDNVQVNSLGDKDSVLMPNLLLLIERQALTFISLPTSKVIPTSQVI